MDTYMQTLLQSFQHNLPGQNNSGSVLITSSGCSRQEEGALAFCSKCFSVWCSGPQNLVQAPENSQSIKQDSGQQVGTPGTEAVIWCF